MPDCRATLGPSGFWTCECCMCASRNIETLQSSLKCDLRKIPTSIAATPRFEPRYMSEDIPTNCCRYAVVDWKAGIEICRVWKQEDAELISNLLNGAGANTNVFHEWGSAADESAFTDLQNRSRYD